MSEMKKEKRTRLLLESNKYSQNSADLLKYKQMLKTYCTVEGFFVKITKQNYLRSKIRYNYIVYAILFKYIN